MAEAMAVALAALNLLPCDHLLHDDDLSPIAHRYAALEGWDLFEADDARLEIQRDDAAGLFASDEDAIAFVRHQAQKGSTLHAIAASLHDPATPAPAHCRIALGIGPTARKG
jgi:hypothetical protein